MCCCFLVCGRWDFDGSQRRFLLFGVVGWRWRRRRWPDASALGGDGGAGALINATVAVQPGQTLVDTTGAGGGNGANDARSGVLGGTGGTGVGSGGAGGTANQIGGGGGGSVLSINGTVVL